MNGLQTVAHIRQRTGHDNGHCIFNEGAFHFLDQIIGNNGLIRKLDILRLIISIFCHL